MHKYVHHRFKLPTVFCEYFDGNKLIHQHDTQQKGMYNKQVRWEINLPYDGIFTQ